MLLDLDLNQLIGRIWFDNVIQFARFDSNHGNAIGAESPVRIAGRCRDGRTFTKVRRPTVAPRCESMHSAS